MSFKVGKYAQDGSDNRGWFVGKFLDGAVKTGAVEIKYWEFPTGPTTHDTKISETFECTLIFSGKCRGTVDGDEFEFNAGDYIAIQPNTPNNLVVEILEPVIGLTIKAPSDPEAKKVL